MNQTNNNSPYIIHNLINRFYWLPMMQRFYFLKLVFSFFFFFCIFSGFRLFSFLLFIIIYGCLLAKASTIALSNGCHFTEGAKMYIKH